MRGTPAVGEGDLLLAGIIPAYAGNTKSCPSPSRRSRDHPRVCGEHSHILGWRDATMGSSPRMRGTHTLRNEHEQYHRDHPRVCGEHMVGTGTCSKYWGSSPRMRGTRRLSAAYRCYLGIIPAYAGNTVFPRTQFLVVRDHPRVCGEHICSALAVPVAKGSSPRMRGTPA